MKKQSTLGMIKATNANAVVLGLSKLKRTLSLLTLALFTGALSSQADIILIVDDNDVADEVTSFNITTGTETSAGLTALEDTQASESWGGGILKDSGGPAITFTLPRSLVIRERSTPPRPVPIFTWILTVWV